MRAFLRWYDARARVERDAALYLVAALSGCGLPVILWAGGAL